MPLRVLCLALLIAASLAPMADAATDPTAPGQLDRMFGRDGVIAAPNAHGPSAISDGHVSDILFPPGGRMLLVERTRLTQLMPSGRLDRRFGRGGHAAAEIGGDGNDQIVRVLRGADGTLTVLARRQRDMAMVLRLRADGHADLSFNKGRPLVLPIDYPEQAWDRFLDGLDGRVTADGTLTVVVAGTVVRRLVGSASIVQKLSIDASGHVLASGVASVPLGWRSDVRLLRSGAVRLITADSLDGLTLLGLTTSLAPDPVVGQDGSRVLAQSWQSMEWAPDGGPFVWNSDGRPPVMKRFDASGREAAAIPLPDPSKGGLTFATAALSAEGRFAFVLKGRLPTDRPVRLGVQMVRANGRADTAFGRSGRVLLDPRWRQREASNELVTFDRAGRVIVSAALTDDLREDFLVGPDSWVMVRLRARRADLAVASRARIDRYGRAAIRLRCRSTTQRCHGTLRIGARSKRFSLARRTGMRAVRMPIHRRRRPGGRRTVTATVVLRAKARDGRVIDSFRVPVRLSRPCPAAESTHRGAGCRRAFG